MNSGLGMPHVEALLSWFPRRTGGFARNGRHLPETIAQQFLSAKAFRISAVEGDINALMACILLEPHSLRKSHDNLLGESFEMNFHYMNEFQNEISLSCASLRRLDYYLAWRH